MTYLVNEKCIKCKLMDCVEVCPVDCFYEGKNMLVIKKIKVFQVVFFFKCTVFQKRKKIRFQNEN